MFELHGERIVEQIAPPGIFEERLAVDGMKPRRCRPGIENSARAQAATSAPK